jgi:hypothetical protein
MQSTPYLVDVTKLLEEQGRRVNAPTPKCYFYKLSYPFGEDNRQEERVFDRYQTTRGVEGGGGRVFMPPTGLATRATPHIQVL